MNPGLDLAFVRKQDSGKPKSASTINDLNDRTFMLCNLGLVTFMYSNVPNPILPSLNYPLFVSPCFLAVFPCEIPLLQANTSIVILFLHWLWNKKTQSSGCGSLFLFFTFRFISTLSLLFLFFFSSRVLVIVTCVFFFVCLFYSFFSKLSTEKDSSNSLQDLFS